MYYVYRNELEWKRVRGDHQKEEQVCARCNNKVRYFLAFDGNEVGLLGILTYKYAVHYAYKCPICPNFEEVSKEVAKAIMKGG